MLAFTISYLRQGLAVQLRLALNSLQPPCLSLIRLRLQHAPCVTLKAAPIRLYVFLSLLQPRATTSVYIFNLTNIDLFFDQELETAQSSVTSFPKAHISHLASMCSY